MADKNLKKHPAQWPKGVSGNPAGRPAGGANKSTLIARALLDGETEALTRKIIEMALAGETACLKVCFERLVPVRRDAPVAIVLPKVESPSDLPRVTQSILEAVSDGALTPGEGLSITNLVDSHRKSLEVEDLDKRIRRLEGRDHHDAR